MYVNDQHTTFVELKWYTMKKKVRNESTDKRQNFLDIEHDYHEQHDTFLILQGHTTYKLKKKY
jgi:hypothetical protein